MPSIQIKCRNYFIYVSGIDYCSFHMAFDSGACRPQCVSTHFTCTLKKIGPCLPVTNGAAGNNTSHVSVWLASHFFGVDNIPSSKVLGLKAPSSF